MAERQKEGEKCGLGHNFHKLCFNVTILPMLGLGSVSPTERSEARNKLGPALRGYRRPLLFFCRPSVAKNPRRSFGEGR